MNLAKSSTLTYRPDIDGLRAIAVLLVVIFHFKLVSGGKSGFIGVDIFFVISGFLITAIITKQLDAGRFSFRSFYLHRIRRLAPALFAVLILVMLAGSFTLFPAELVELSKQVLASQLYVANIYYWKNISYFGLNADNVYLLHTWSLAVEEQFYLIYPLVVFLVYRHFKRYLWVVLALALAASFFLNLLFVAAKPEATFYLLPTRAWELLVGSMALYMTTRYSASRNVNELLGIVGIGLIAVGVVTFHEGIHFPGAFALIPTLGAACLIVSGSSTGTYVSRMLSVRPVVYIGRISYTLYLVHWPMNVFSKQIFGPDYTESLRILMFLFSIVLSMVIFHAIENPVRNGRLLSTSGRIAMTYFSGLTVTFVLVTAVNLTNGLPNRFPDEVIRLANFVEDKSDDMPECEYHGKPLEHQDQFCRIGVRGKSPEWLVFGDSHAWANHDAFDKWLASRGQAGLFMFRNSCPPISGVHIYGDQGSCFAFNNAISSFLEKKSTVHNVLLVSTWRQAIEGRLSTSSDLRITNDESVKLFDRRFAASLQSIHDQGKRVYIWEPVPGARDSVPIALATAAKLKRVPEIEFSRDEYFSDFDFFFKAERKQAMYITQSFSPSAALCGSGSCKVALNGNPLYFDNAHASKSSANFWATMLADQYKEDVNAKHSPSRNLSGVATRKMSFQD
jgi:peptidoglycan/LPS O-acetylase OafA/YrhL